MKYPLYHFMLVYGCRATVSVIIAIHQPTDRKTARRNFNPAKGEPDAPGEDYIR